MYLGGRVKNEGHEIRILDQASLKLTNEKMLQRIKKWDPDIVGFSVLSQSLQTAKVLGSELRDWNPNLKIIFGNYMPTFYGQRMIDNYPWLDACVRGEGEETFKELLDAWALGYDIGTVAGLTYRKNGHAKENPERPLIADLDSIPFPDRDLIPDVYQNRMNGISMSARKFTIMVTSRGCPYSCTFCACSTFNRHKVRGRSSENVIKELSELAGRGYEELLLVDDNFTCNKKRVVDLCEKIRKEKLEFNFTTDGRVNHADFNMLRQMAVTGFKTLMFGFESGVQRLLDYYNKKITIAQSRNIVKVARKAGIDTIIGAFLIGAYDETYEEAAQTLDFIKSVDIDFPQLIMTRALPGTPMYYDLVRRNVLDDAKYWETGVDVIDLPGTLMKRKALHRLVSERFPKIFFNHKYMMRTVYRSFMSKYRRDIMFGHFDSKSIKQLSKLISNPLDLF